MSDSDEDKVATPPSKTHEKKPQLTPEAQARQEVIRVLRSRNDVARALGLHGSPSDRAILHALGKEECAFDVLRNNGYSLTNASLVQEILPLALKAPEPEAPKEFKFQWRIWACACIFAVIAGLLCALALKITVESTQGYLQGECSISLFTNQTCFQEGGSGCGLEVTIVVGGKFYTKRHWQPPKSMNHRTNRIQYMGNAFRCCDPQGLMDCCLFFNEKTSRFCDDYGPEEDDLDGETCNAGKWPCLFTLDASSDDEGVLELKEYEAPLTWPLFAAAGTLLSVLACGACYGFLVSTGKLGKSLRDRRNSKRSSQQQAWAKDSKGVRQPSTIEDPDELDATSPTDEGVQSRELPMSVSEQEDHDDISMASPKVERGPSWAGPERGSQKPSHALEDVSSPSPAPAVPQVVRPTPPPCKMKTLFVVEAEDEEDNEDDMNPALRGGDLASLADKPIGHLMRPIIDPLEQTTPKSSRRTSPQSSASRRRPHVGTSTAASWGWAGQTHAVDGHHVLDDGESPSLRATAGQRPLSSGDSAARTHKRVPRPASGGPAQPDAGSSSPGQPRASRRRPRERGGSPASGTNGPRKAWDAKSPV